VGALALATGAAAPAATVVCPNIPLPDRLEEADAAFVGRMTEQRAEGEGQVYRFDVRQRVKGPIGSVVEVRSVEPLTDADGRPLARGEAVGVLAELEGAVLTTSACLLTDPGALLAVADEPRGLLLKLAIGFVILGIVLAWSIRRRRSGTRPSLPGAPGSPAG
jgi:hypothetical protein